MPMSVKDYESKRAIDCYLHIRDLPWSACQADIQNHFKSLNISEGDVSILGSDAFVCVDARTALLATEKPDQAILGRPVQMSIVDSRDVRDMFLQNVRRRLSFDTADVQSVKAMHPAKKRKIRPTLVKEQQRSSHSCSVFSVEEVEMTYAPSKVAERSLSCGARRSGARICGRKIHPTPADGWTSAKLPVFHPEVFEASGISRAAQM